MRWIIVLILIGLVYWLFVSGYVNLNSSLQYITTAITEAVNGIATMLKNVLQ